MSATKASIALLSSPGVAESVEHDCLRRPCHRKFRCRRFQATLLPNCRIKIFQTLSKNRAHLGNPLPPPLPFAVLRRLWLLPFAKPRVVRSCASSMSNGDKGKPGLKKGSFLVHYHDLCLVTADLRIALPRRSTVLEVLSL